MLRLQSAEENPQTYRYGRVFIVLEIVLVSLGARRFGLDLFLGCSGSDSPTFSSGVRSCQAEVMLMR